MAVGGTPKGPVRYGRLRLVLICCAIAANALSAGGVYCFPLIAPALVKCMKFTQPQLTTVALAGMAGQYPFAALVGKLLDKYGARTCSFAAAIFLSLGFWLCTWEISRTPVEITRASSWLFYRFTCYFLMIGLGTVLSYFSFVFSATKTFAHYMGIASGTSLAIFGFSPLLLSAIASKFFTHPTTGLNATSFLGFMAAFTMIIHLFSGIVMPGPERPLIRTSEEDASDNAPDSLADPDPERCPLLTSDVGKAHVYVPEPQHGTAVELLRDPYFWLFLCVNGIIIGVAEMVMTNLGSIVMSLPSSSQSSAANVATQVQFMSISNTAARLLVGPLADFVSPVAAYLHDGAWSFPRKHHISRLVFLAGACSMLFVTFFWLLVGVRTQEALWPLSIGIGFSYGTIFTNLPGIIGSIWGLPNLGRNFGIFSYAPFIGTTLFSYLYAFVAALNTDTDEDACVGVKCWSLTIWLSVSSTVLAICGTAVLWRQWKGRV